MNDWLWLGLLRRENVTLSCSIVTAYNDYGAMSPFLRRAPKLLGLSDSQPSSSRLSTASAMKFLQCQGSELLSRESLGECYQGFYQRQYA